MVKKKEQVNTVQEAQILVREKIGKIAHDAKQSHRSYSYTSHEAVTAAVVPAMHEVGMTHKFEFTDLQIVNDFAMVHCIVTFRTEDSSDEISVFAGDKLRDGTTMGAISSYALKVAMVKYFGLESGEKDLEQIQADEDEKARMKAARKDVEKTVEIFDGKEVEPSHREEMKGLAKEDFLMLCGELGVTNEQIEARIKKEGYEDLSEVSEDKLEEWNETMTKKVGELECMKDG